ncbi:membrane protein [Pseudonocardia hierapolitana]|uniref:Membrane protein n=1 Tax=Pseudonocardia hierapolitana TaxID=1128676 RepID=A0A561T4Y0_9PSEU|nr:membrane protein [Pseudonocardia hierapolitana]
MGLGGGSVCSVPIRRRPIGVNEMEAGSMMSRSSSVARLQAAVVGLRARHEWIDHLLRAGVRYHERHGNHFAAAITFFSILNAVPLLMIAYATAGYVLALNSSLLAALDAGIARAVPPELSDTIEPVVHAAIAQRNTVAGIGLLAALWAGTWWMFNLREAVSAQWTIPPRNPASPRRLLSDIAALAGLWIAVIGSLAISAVGTGLGETVLGLLGWQGADWSQLTRTGFGLLLSLVTDWLIFFWIITRLPRTRQHIQGAARAALLGAIGLEVLKQGLTIYLGGITGSPGGTIFGTSLGLLVFAYLVSRFVLFMTAWAATVRGNQEPAPDSAPVVVPSAAPSAGPARSEPGIGVAVAMIGSLLIGVLVGARLRQSRRGSP